MIDKNTVKRARQVNLVDYLNIKGYELKQEGLNYRVEGYQGLIIQGNHWHSFSHSEGGNALDFLVEYLGMKFDAAIKELSGAVVVEKHQGPRLSNKTLELPTRNSDDRRVMAYLVKTRGLPAVMVVQLIRDELLYQDVKGNCVFVCSGHDGQPHNALINGTLSGIRYKRNAPGGDISYPWQWPAVEETDMVTVVESPIDATSLAVLRPGCRRGHIIALGGLHKQGIDGFLRRTTGIKRIVLALDNDKQGQQAAQELLKELLSRGYQVWNLTPTVAKDWNDFLRSSLDAASF